MALCGGGCMGFVNMVEGLRAIGYHEQDRFLPARSPSSHTPGRPSRPLASRPATRLDLGRLLGQELVTTAASYSTTPSLSRGRASWPSCSRPPATGGVPRFAREARSAGIPVVALTVGASASGRAMVAAHSGALAGSDAMWEALFEAHGVLRVGVSTRWPTRSSCWPRAAASFRGRPSGVAGESPPCTIREPSGPSWSTSLSRSHFPLRDLAGHDRAPRAAARPGLDPVNPLDVWGRGASTRELFAGSLTALAGDEAVDAVALCVDFVQSSTATVPTPRLSSTAGRRQRNRLPDLQPLELARPPGGPAPAGGGHPGAGGNPQRARRFAHLLRAPEAAAAAVNDGTATAGGQPVDPDGEHTGERAWRRGRCRARRVSPPRRLRDRHRRLRRSRQRRGGGGRCRVHRVAGRTEDGQPSVSHKTDAGGVFLGLVTPAEVRRAYAEMSRRLGPQAVVTAMAPAGVEMALGVVQDPLVGPIVVVGAGGVLVRFSGTGRWRCRRWTKCVPTTCSTG